ncbi:hypothetical protein AB0L63_03960 [Nocardia sp. NPDC051990]|uniref:hypothetical protein n=1 Tax=Nocardia sp. NPDC051990 TaxID=3155285 RepID=UPI00341D23ED
MGELASRYSATESCWHSPPSVTTESATEPFTGQTPTRPELTPAHQAVADYDLPLLRALLDQGHDIENDDGNGHTLLRHAVEVEYIRHDRTGEPLHADISTFLLARGADPHNRDLTGTSCIDHAHHLGHWLAHQIMHAWTTRPQYVDPIGSARD